jgi:hypothetical protein
MLPLVSYVVVVDSATLALLLPAPSTSVKLTVESLKQRSDVKAQEQQQVVGVRIHWEGRSNYVT